MVKSCETYPRTARWKCTSKQYFEQKLECAIGGDLSLCWMISKIFPRLATKKGMKLWKNGTQQKSWRVCFSTEIIVQFRVIWGYHNFSYHQPWSKKQIISAVPCFCVASVVAGLSRAMSCSALCSWHWTKHVDCFRNTCNQRCVVDNLSNMFFASFLVMFLHIWLPVTGIWTPEITFFRLISALTHYSAIVSDIPLANIYVLYILTFYLTFFLAYTLTDILSGIYSDILSGKYAGIYSGIHSGILCGIYYDTLSGMISGIYSDSLSDMATEIRRSPLKSHWDLDLRPGSAHWNLGLAVEIRQCPLRSGGSGSAHWDRGPAVPAEIWGSQLRSRSAHWDLESAVGEEGGRRRKEEEGGRRRK